MRYSYLCIFNVEDIFGGRKGAKHDVVNLKTTFEKMGATVDLVPNPDNNAIKTKIKELKEKDFSKYRYVAVAYLSHGKEDNYVWTSNEVIQIEKSILEPLCENHTLNEKLKWIIMSTCRGDYDIMEDESEGPEELITYPLYYLKCYATMEGMHSWRDDHKGSFYIDALCNRLKIDFKTKDLVQIIDEASEDTKQETKERLVKPILGVDGKKTNKRRRTIQVPCKYSNLGERKFYITTGFRDG